MKHRPWLKYVHWFGYFTTVIVVLQLLFLGYIAAAEWKRREDRREATQMHNGAASERLYDAYGDELEIALLNRLPRLETLAPDGFRFVATPSFGDTDFAVAIRRTPNGGEGVVIIEPHSGGDSASQVISIKLSPSDFSRLVSSLDNLAAAWEGESDLWTDGTGVVLERISGTKISSGFGNSPNFYGKIGALVFEAVRPAAPQLAQFDTSWHPKDR